jgi:hypothetical protein
LSSSSDQDWLAGDLRRSRGLYGADAMTAMRLGTRRAGIIDKMVPRAVEEWLTHRVEAEPPGGSRGTS